MEVLTVENLSFSYPQAGGRALVNVTCSVRRGEFVALCGATGSGKSTLAIDTIFAEGQSRYVESLSSYARQFLGQLE